MSVYWLIGQPKDKVPESGNEEAESPYMAKSYTPGKSLFLRGCKISFYKNNLMVKNEGRSPISLLPLNEQEDPVKLNPGYTKKLNYDFIRVFSTNSTHSSIDRKRKGVCSLEQQMEPSKKKAKLVWTEAEITDKKEGEKEEFQTNSILNSFILYKEVSYSGSDTNFLFYTNKVTSKPDNAYINDFHKKWFGDYDQLEASHGFIQWLFPIFDASLFNWSSVPLSRTEARLIRRNEVAAKNVVASYKLMLNFYGLRLVNEKTGEIDYVEDTKLKRSRMKNLNNMSHNYLRITRILKSLGHLGFTRYKKPFLDALYRAVFTDKLVPNARESYKNFWAATVQYDSPKYFEFTNEIPEDREPSIFFSMIQ